LKTAFKVRLKHELLMLVSHSLSHPGRASSLLRQVRSINSDVEREREREMEINTLRSRKLIYKAISMDGRDRLINRAAINNNTFH